MNSISVKISVKILPAFFLWNIHWILFSEMLKTPKHTMKSLWIFHNDLKWVGTSFHWNLLFIVCFGPNGQRYSLLSLFKVNTIIISFHLSLAMGLIYYYQFQYIFTSSIIENIKISMVYPEIENVKYPLYGTWPTQQLQKENIKYST